MLTLLASFAQEESRSVSENQKWRIRKMFEQGRPNTGRMLGYRLKDGVLQIVPEEAEIVRMIFSDYLSGMGRNAIIKKLNRLKIPTMYGGPWSESTIYQIITNEKYAGDMLLQKTYRLDHISKKTVINRGELPQYYVENSHEPIIDRETFALVQQEVKRRTITFPVKTAPEPYPFTGILHCGFCGKRFKRKIVNAGSKYAKPAWICPTFNSRGKEACPAQQIPERILSDKTSEVLGFTDWNREILLQHIAAIQVPGHNRLVYMFQDGHTQEITWQNPSRRKSWTGKMKQAARERQLKIAERMRKE